MATPQTPQTGGVMRSIQAHKPDYSLSSLFALLSSNTAYPWMGVNPCDRFWNTCDDDNYLICEVEISNRGWSNSVQIYPAMHAP